MEGKINKLKQGIFETHLDELKFKLNDVISMGELYVFKLK